VLVLNADNRSCRSHGGRLRQGERFSHVQLHELAVVCGLRTSDVVVHTGVRNRHGAHGEIVDGNVHVTSLEHSGNVLVGNRGLNVAIVPGWGRSMNT